MLRDFDKASLTSDSSLGVSLLSLTCHGYNQRFSMKKYCFESGSSWRTSHVRLYSRNISKYVRRMGNFETNVGDPILNAPVIYQK